MVPKYHQRAFILLLSNSGQSQLHFVSKFILVGTCVDFHRRQQKIDIFTKNTESPQKGSIFAFKGPRKVLMASFWNHHGPWVDRDEMGIKNFPAWV